MFEFWKKLTKQTVLVGIIMLIVFFIWPGATLLFFIGVVVGLVGGNLYEPVESWIEKLIARF